MSMGIVEAGREAEDAARKLMGVRMAQSALRKDEKEIKAALMGELGEEGVAPDGQYVAGMVMIELKTQEGAGKISADKLRELGVGPEVIANATVRAEYQQIKVKERKGE